MSDEQKPVDILFIVPDRLIDTWRRAIKLTRWALDSDKTVDAMSADTFVHLYGEMPVEEMDEALKKRCVALCNSGDISEREWKEFKPLRDKLYAYWEATRDETSEAQP